MHYFTAFSLLVCIAVLCNANSCKVKVNDYEYDVSTLIGKGTAEHGYFQTISAGGEKVLYNLCGGLVHPLGGACDASSAGCQVDNNNDPWSLGSVVSDTSAAHPNGADKGFRMTYANGDSAGCQDKRKFTVTYTCDKAATTPRISHVTEPAGCDYAFTLTSDKACPVTGSGGDKPPKSSNVLGTVLWIFGCLVLFAAIAGGLFVKFGQTLRKSNQKFVPLIVE